MRGGLLVFCVLSVVALLACGTPVSGPSGTQDDNYEFDGSPFKGDGMTGKHEGSSGDGDAGDGDGGGDGDSPGDGDGGSSGGGSGSGSGGGDVGPVSLPAPTLKKTLVASADKEGNVPAVGYPGAVDTKDENYDPDAKYQVIMTPKNESFANAPHPNFPRPLWERIFYSPLPRGEGIKGRVTKFISSLIPQVIAESPPPNTCSETLADSLDMNLDDAACCDVKKDGSFTCYYKDKEVEAVDYAKLESQEYCLYLTDGKDMMPFQVPSPPVGEGQGEGCETPNKHALWLSQTSFDVVPYKSLSADNGYEGFKVLANPSKTRLDPNIDIGTNIIGIRSIIPSPEISPPSMGGDQGEGESLRVIGNHANHYGEMSVNASELAFAEDNLLNTFALRRIVDPVFGVKEVCQQQGGEFNFICEFFDVVGKSDDLEKYLKLKTTRDGQIWFSGKYKKQDETKAYVYNLKDGALEDSYIPITEDDKDVDGKDITVSEILNFDVDENGFALAVFRDDKGALKMRMGHEAQKKRYGLQQLPINQIADIQIYKVDSEIAENKKTFTHHALLLDSSENKLHQLVAKEKNTQINIEGAILVGKSPTEMALNSESNKVFVINSGDATVTVVPLLNDAAEVLTVEEMESQKETINLKELFAEKSIPFKPEQIVYDDLGTTDNSDDRLIIGDKGLRSAVVLPTNYVINGMPKKLTPLIDLLPGDVIGPAILQPKTDLKIDAIKKVDFQKLFP